ncbi:MAG: nuclear transport factor 2 family protein [Flavobacteriales bacterium]
MNNKELINRFYMAFASEDAEAMAGCYADVAVFDDPAFGRLNNGRVRNMWRMLIKNSGGNLKITHSDVWADDWKGGAKWVAEYTFSKTGRKVVNRIDAQFEFKDGKIIHHVDHFDFWKWSRQALGLVGLLLGWTLFLQNKVRQQALASLNRFEQGGN